MGVNDLTIVLIKDTWKAKRKTCQSFARFSSEVENEYHAVFGTEVLMPMVVRAFHLAHLFNQEHFDPKDMCQGCEFTLTNQVCTDFADWWLDRHPEWKLSSFTETDLAALGISFGQPIQIAFRLAF